PVGCGYAAQFGDGDGTKPCHRPPACQARYGPWTPPPARPGQVVQDWTHTYTASGFFTVDFEFNLNDDCGQNPYRSSGSVTMQVTVRP
ncbi:MAG: hypothetical protein QOG64_2672, partial [Acidimicrobiaceae bacterium]|nr:hypothetical protein [Acidimicrobiaceae bacterium]